VTARHHPLDDHLRGLLQDEACLLLDGVGKEDDGGQHENNKGVDQDQRAIFPLSPEEGRKGESMICFCLSSTFSLIPLIISGGGKSEPEGKCSSDMGES